MKSRTWGTLLLFSIVKRALEILLPRGLWNRLDSTNSAFMSALATSLTRVVTFVDDIRFEAIPWLSTNQLRQWFTDLGVVYDPLKFPATLRKQIEAVYTAIGGQSPEYLEAQIQKQFPAVTIIERTGPYGPDPLVYTLTGEIDGPAAIEPTFLTLVRKLFPLHLELNNTTTISDLITSDVCGAGRVGAAIVGKAIGEE